MDSAVLYACLYFGLGALVGQLHLLRCPTCHGRFEEWTEYAKYIGAAAVTGLPVLVWAFISYGLGPCEE